jgi:hypothetical protein
MSPKDHAFLLHCARTAAKKFLEASDADLGVAAPKDFDAEARALQIALIALLPTGALWSDKTPSGFGLYWAIERKSNRCAILVDVFIASGGAQCFRQHCGGHSIDNPQDWHWCATRQPPVPEDQPK